MPKETESLVLKVESADVKKATDALGKLAVGSVKAEKATDKFEKSTKQSTRSNTAATRATDRKAKAEARATRATDKHRRAQDKLKSSFLRVGGAVGAAIAPILIFKKLLSETVSIQQFRARLETATGSVKDAAEAFSNLEEFASKTPFALEQSLEAFTTLTNLGLTPSMAALESYGNTASAMGKDLGQLIEAVADAATGEFERLKEFGIKAKSEGENVSFIFQGVTTTVGKNAAEIEKYLMGIGEVNFAGSMDRQMATVGGQLSNLGDLWNKLFRTITEQGAEGAIGRSMNVLIGLFEDLIEIIQRPEVGQEIEKWAIAFAKFVEETGKALPLIIGIGVQILKVVVAVKAYQVAVGIATVANKAFASSTILMAGPLGALVVALGAVSVAAYQVGKAFDSAREAEDRFNFKRTPLQNAQIRVDDRKKAAGIPLYETPKQQAARQGNKRIAAGIVGISPMRETVADTEGNPIKRGRGAGFSAGGPSPVSFATERKSFGGSLKESIEGIPEAIAGALQAKSAPGGSGLASKGLTGAQGGSGGASAFDQLVEDLASQEAAIEQSYLNRLELINNNTREGSQIRAELQQTILGEYIAESEAAAAAQVEQFDILKNKLSVERGLITSEYAIRRKAILENAQLTEQQKTELVTRLTQERNKTLSQLESQRAKQGLALADNYFSNFANLAQSSNDKLAKIGQAGMIVQRGIAIAMATIKTYEAAQSAYAAGVVAGAPYASIPVGIAFAAAATAAGLANVASIASTPLNFAAGGIVPGASFSGDNVRANVNSGEMILNSRQQANLFDQANGRGSQSAPVINIYNQNGSEVKAGLNGRGEIEVFIREAADLAKNELTEEAHGAPGSFVSSLQANFDMKRVGGGN